MVYATPVSLAIKDAAGSSKNLLTFSNGTQQAYGMSIIDNLGNLVTEVLPLQVRTPPLIIASATYTRTADGNVYAFGDLIADTVTAGSVTAMTITGAARGIDIPGTIVGATLEKSGTTTTNCLIRAHIFGANPVSTAPTNGDNGAFAPAVKASYFGWIDFALTPFAFLDGCRAPGVLCVSEMNFTPVPGTANLRALLEARGAYTPGNAETFTLTTHVK